MLMRSLISWRPVALLAVLLAPAASFGQALADRVPADALVYVGWRGVQSLGPGYDQSNFKAVIQQTQIEQFCDEFLPKLADRAAQEDPNAAQAIGIFRAIAGPMWRHPSAFFFAGVDFSNPNMPVPHVGLISQAGNEAGALEKQVQDLLHNVPPLPFPVNVVRSGDLVAVLVGYLNTNAGLAGGEGGAKPLAGDTNFTSALAQVSKDGVSTAYVNVEGLVDLLDQAVRRFGPPDAQQNVPKIEAALGVHDVKRLIFTQAFDGKDWATRAFAAVPEPRHGLVSMLDNVKPLSNDIYSTIPQNVRLAGATHFDFAALISAIRAAVGQVQPNADQMIDAVFEQISQTVGVDVRKDLLGSLGDEWAYYIDPDVMGRSLLGFTAVNRLKDSAKAEQSIAKVEQFIANVADQQLKDKKITLAFHETKSGDVTIHYLGIPFVAPSWAIAHGNLYIGLYPQVVLAAATRGAGGKSILDNKAFTDLRDRLGGDRAASIQFADLPRLAPDSYASWVAVSRVSGFGDLFGVPAPPLLLPSLDKIMPYLSAAGGVTWVAADGLHLRAIEPFPGSELLASDPMSMGAAQPAVMMSILLPALNKAREQAKAVKSANNLKQIGLSAIMYADQHQGKLPPDLGTLAEQSNLPPMLFVSPNGKAQLPPNLSADSKAEQKRWINEHADYVWYGGGKPIKNMSSTTVIASEKPQGANNGLNFLFADGHVEFVSPMPRAMEQLRAAESGHPARPNNLMP